MLRVAYLLLLTGLAPMVLPVAAAMAQDDLYKLRGVKENPVFDDTYHGSNNLCGSDCARQDRIREDEPRRPYELENAFNNGRKGKTVSDIVSNQLEPSGGR